MSESMQLQKPSHLISLASSAVLVSVDINVWSATKQDRVISDEVTTAKKADKSAGRYVKNLLADHPKHKALINYRQTIYNWMKRRTYRWNQSQDLLPAIDMPRFMEEFRSHETEFNNLLSEPQIVRNKFYIEEFVSRVPEGDFRNAIFNETAEQLKQHYERQAQNIIDRVMEDAAERLVASAVRISNACSEPEQVSDDGRTKRKKIYETTLSQAVEICDTLKNFNITNNPELELARAQLEEAIQGVTIDDLRESAYRRSVVKDSVDDMLSKFRPLKVNV